jgi:transposase-like protein
LTALEISAVSVLSKPYFHDEAAAFQHLESVLWPEAPICPHCGSINAKHYDLGKTRLGLRKCAEKACRKQFTVKVGTVFQQAHIPLNKCLLALYLMCASKKGMSAHQLHRTLEIGYKAAWFLCHRVREAMRDGSTLPDLMGGPTSVVEADETYIGGKAKNRAHRKPAPKKAVLSLVERDGRVRSFHVANVTSETVKPIIAANADKASMLMTDESVIYPKIGAEFSAHGTVNHSGSKYARLGGFVHINASENFFSIVKRGITGVYHSVSEAHLHRHLAEFDFRYNNRSGLGVEDAERAGRPLVGVKGKRLTYRPSR